MSNTRKLLIQDGRCLDRDYKLSPPEYTRGSGRNLLNEKFSYVKAAMVFGSRILPVFCCVKIVKYCFKKECCILDRLCGLVGRLPGWTPKGPASDSRRCQIFLVAVGLERVPLSPCEDK
jgi:hypothetical protein